MMSFTTQPNISPKLSSATLLSHGPMSAFVSYEITDDGGEPMTETGCYVYLTGEPENKQKCIVENFDGKKGKSSCASEIWSGMPTMNSSLSLGIW